MFDTGTIEKIRAKLLERQQTIAVAESVTSGLLQAAFSTAQDAMQFYQGGITTYNIGQKARHLNINPIHALQCNCVSQKMAEDMAASACSLFSSNWGIGITGYASPVPESEDKQLAYFAICLNGEVCISRKIYFEKGEPFDAQVHYVTQILRELAGLVCDTPAKPDA